MYCKCGSGVMPEFLTEEGEKCTNCLSKDELLVLKIEKEVVESSNYEIIELTFIRCSNCKNLAEKLRNLEQDQMVNLAYNSHKLQRLISGLFRRNCCSKCQILIEEIIPHLAVEQCSKCLRWIFRKDVYFQENQLVCPSCRDSSSIHVNFQTSNSIVGLKKENFSLKNFDRG